MAPFTGPIELWNDVPAVDDMSIVAVPENHAY